MRASLAGQAFQPDIEPPHVHRPLRQAEKPDLRARLAALGLACLLIVGCGGTPEPADPSAARRALTSALDAWADGSSPADLHVLRPAVYVADEDWQAGRRLSAYKLADDDRMLGLTLRCPVILTLEDERGRRIERHVTYAVATSPVVSIVRED